MSTFHSFVVNPGLNCQLILVASKDQPRVDLNLSYIEMLVIAFILQRDLQSEKLNIATKLQKAP